VQARLVATDVTAMLLKDTGHWLMSERPAEVKAALREFFAK
jgi:pimeloyl-ACP methyl ester carboxylesterase